MNYYADSDKLMKNFWSLNRKWFENRSHLSDEQLQRIARISYEIERKLTEIRQVLNETRVGGGDNHGN